MNKVFETLATAQKSNVQAAEGLAGQAYAGMEKLVELNLAASKAAMSESFSHVQALMGAKDVKDVMALQTAFLQPLAGKSAAYMQHVQTIATAGSSEFTGALEAKLAEAQKSFDAAVAGLTKNAPAGSEAAVAAFQNAVATSQKALEAAQASVKNATELAQSNFTKASKQAMDLAQKASKTA